MIMFYVSSTLLPMAVPVPCPTDAALVPDAESRSSPFTFIRCPGRIRSIASRRAKSFGTFSGGPLGTTRNPLRASSRKFSLPPIVVNNIIINLAEWRVVRCRYDTIGPGRSGVVRGCEFA